MGRITEKNEFYLKLFVWGAYNGGKTSLLESFYRITKNNYDNINPVGEMTKINMPSGSTIFFDRAIFKGSDFYTLKEPKEIYFHIYTAGGFPRLASLRKNLFKGTDGIIILFDAQRSRLESNMLMLRELKAINGNNLINKIPLIVVLNKCDLENRIQISEVRDIMKSIGLYYGPDHPLYLRNPRIFETIAIENKEKGIYAAFSEIIQKVITDVNLQKINLKPNGPITSIQGIYA